MKKNLFAVLALVTLALFCRRRRVRRGQVPHRHRHRHGEPVRGRPARRRAADQGARRGEGRRDDPAPHLPGRLHVPAGDLHLLRRLPRRRSAHEGHRREPGHPRHRPRRSSASAPSGPTSCSSPASRTRTRWSSRAPPTSRSSNDFVVPRLHDHLGRQAARGQDLRPHLLPPPHVLRDPGPQARDHGRGLQGPRPEVRLRDRSRPDLRRRRGGRPAVHPREGPPVDPEVRQGTAPSSAPTTPTPSPCSSSFVAYGGIFVEADLPSPLMGYPGALGHRPVQPRRATSPPS